MQAINFHDTRHGTMAHFSADQCIGLSLQRYGEWAQDEIALLRHFIAPGDTVLDLGANVGVHTLAFARLVGPGGRVVAVEGEPATYGLLSYNLIANGLSEIVTAIPALVGSGEGLVAHSFRPAGDNVGARSFFADVRGLAAPQAGPALTTKLPLVTVDSLGLQACAVMKIDVERMELDALRGSAAVLRRLRPAVYFEYASGDAEALGETLALLRGAGYRAWWHVANPFNSRNSRGDTHNIFGGNVEINILALPDGREPPRPLPELTDPNQDPPRPSLEAGLPGVAVED